MAEPADSKSAYTRYGKRPVIPKTPFYGKLNLASRPLASAATLFGVGLIAGAIFPYVLADIDERRAPRNAELFAARKAAAKKMEPALAAEAIERQIFVDRIVEAGTRSTAFTKDDDS